MAEIVMIVPRPSPRIYADMLGVAACRHDCGPPGSAAAIRLRTSAWTSLKRLREIHGTLAEAERVAEMRALIGRVAGTSSGTAS